MLHMTFKWIAFFRKIMFNCHKEKGYIKKYHKNMSPGNVSPKKTPRGNMSHKRRAETSSVQIIVISKTYVLNKNINKLISKTIDLTT